MRAPVRDLQERMVGLDDEKPITEWEPAQGEEAAAFKAGRLTVRELNARAKRLGSQLRYRSVAREDEFE